MVFFSLIPLPSSLVLLPFIFWLPGAHLAQKMIERTHHGARACINLSRLLKWSRNDLVCPRHASLFGLHAKRTAREYEAGPLLCLPFFQLNSCSCATNKRIFFGSLWSEEWHMPICQQFLPLPKEKWKNKLLCNYRCMLSLELEEGFLSH